MIEDTTNFANSYFFWNLVLDESGLSRWNWRQNSLLTVDRKTETVHHNHEFYAMKHLSATVLPGAQRIAVQNGPLLKTVAFRNPDGSRVLIILNDTEQAISAVLGAPGSAVQFDLPALSMITLTLR
ncbi:MAG: glycoside hydrolase family 30 protein [Opitutaceae bacterium]|nr:glycoside hydrolase family 30 protein [Opitutaceae bacterium]